MPALTMPGYSFNTRGGGGTRTSAAGVGRSGGSGGGVSFSPSAYGSIPMPTAIPQSVWQETQAADPNFAGMQAGSDAIIQGQQAGQLSPETIRALQDSAATFGVGSGMPGSGLQTNRGSRDLGRSVQDLQQLGLTNYLNSLKTVGSMQLDPSLVSNINTYNNQLAAAPDPASAAAQEEALWQSHYNQTRSPAGGTGTGAGGGGGGVHYGGSSAATKTGNPFSASWGESGSVNNAAPIIAYGPGYGTPDPAPAAYNPGIYGNTQAGGNFNGTGYSNLTGGDEWWNSPEGYG